MVMDRVPVPEQLSVTGALPAPVIDIQGLFNASAEQRREVAGRLMAAARDHGACYVIGHGIAGDACADLASAARAFHSRPRSFKMRSWAGFTTNHRGYLPVEEFSSHFSAEGSCVEAWDMSFDGPAEHPDFRAGWRMTGPNVWPEIDGWKATVSGYYRAVFDLGLRLLDAFSRDLDADLSAIAPHLSCPISPLRLLRHLASPGLARREPANLLSGSDTACFAIVAHDGRGLQIQDGDGWIMLPAVPGGLLVSVGGVFETWSAGALRQRKLRAVGGVNEAYSMPFFFGLDYDAIVAPQRKPAAPSSLAQYPAFKFGDRIVRGMAGEVRYIGQAQRIGQFCLDSSDILDRDPGNDAVTDVGGTYLPPHPDFAHRHDVPREIVLGEFRLSVLTPRDLIEDYEAVIAAGPLIRGVFEVDWPDGLSLADNLEDLTRHEREFVSRRSFAWIIRDRSDRYIGCAYLFPKPEVSGIAAAYYWIANVPQRDMLLIAFGGVFEPWLRDLCGKKCKLAVRFQ